MHPYDVRRFSFFDIFLPHQGILSIFEIPKLHVYEYTYSLTGATCPKILVKPGTEEQQVTITAPYAAGTATILVKMDENSSQYTIDFVKIPAATVQLQSILINGVALEGFDPQHAVNFATAACVLKCSEPFDFNHETFDEIEKLASYAGPGGTIRAADVGSVVTPSAESTMSFFICSKRAESFTRSA